MQLTLSYKHAFPGSFHFEISRKNEKKKKSIKEQKYQTPAKIWSLLIREKVIETSKHFAQTVELFYNVYRDNDPSNEWMLAPKLTYLD